MHVTQLRNATVVLDFESGGRPVSLLVDPMLAARAALPTLKWFTRTRRRNPLVDLPPRSSEVLASVTHALITHCQRGHFDHLDRAGARFLRERDIPVFCTPHDASYLRERGMRAQPVSSLERAPFFHGHISAIPCVHGRGWVGGLMEHGVGYFIELPGEPSVYLAGDTLLTDAVRACITERRPDIAIVPAGGARFDAGGDILMDGDDALELARLTTGRVLANHLEALDHCPCTRKSLRAAARQAGLEHKLLVPEDGERYTCPHGG
ncbi:hypothetical protein A176_005234 [Myxococcus hansupus]|uniref:Metallo-beta-lactamase domain-containing protein n=1 Tax=Pseudomyxococcus hansupus TaxID=1297742 RepID=A0A0H4XJ73_9BACT|nr:MBL fold metallo-hydrolase [Myxococcus hansupus]AKQ68322.1 hypothetical protein A176_005234 [Myxococcus hansupus]